MKPALANSKANESMFPSLSLDNSSSLDNQSRSFDGQTFMTSTGKLKRSFLKSNKNKDSNKEKAESEGDLKNNSRVSLKEKTAYGKKVFYITTV